MTLTFVNLKGDPVSVTPVKTTKSKPLAPDSFHKGWLVIGFSPERLQLARDEHRQASAALAQSGKPPAPPFDEVAFMRTSTPGKARSQPYAVYEAAEQCAELMRKAGWKMVRSVPKAKGGK